MITLTIYQSQCEDQVLEKLEPNEFSHPKIRKMTLNQAYEKVERESKQISGQINSKFEKFMKNLNLDCVKEKVKLSQNGNKQLMEIEMFILMVKSVTACSGHDANDFWKILIEENLPKRKFQMTPSDLQCVKLHFQRQYPESRLVEDFNKNLLTEAQIQACDEEIKEKDSHIEDGIERIIGGSDLSTITCGVLDVPKVKSILYKMSLMANVNKSEFVKLEVEKLPSIFTELADKIYDCIMIRFDEMEGN